LDADTVVLKNIDHLFQQVGFAAVLEVVDKFNSGVMVLEPSKILFNDLLSKINTLPSYDGGDQGFLNEYFAETWTQLSFYYNAMESAYPASAWDLDKIKVIHFMKNKPWQHTQDSDFETPHAKVLNNFWWQHYKQLPLQHQNI